MPLPLPQRPLALGLIAALAWSGSAAGARPPRLVDLHTVRSPAAAGSGGPSLAVAADGGVFMSWYERVDTVHVVLRVSRFVREGWTEATTVAEGDSFAVNWANVPALAALGGDKLMAGWSWKSGGDPEASDVRLSGSTDGGRTWTPPIVPHRDRTATEHGFVSLVAAQGGGARAFWLDGRKFAGHPAGPSGEREGGEMTLRTAWVGMDGSLADEAEVDDRVCDCCQTGAVGQGSRAFVVYRDRSGSEIRDVSLAWLSGGRWSDPASVHADGWRIQGCPVNGPAIDRLGQRIAIAWFTMAGDSAAVRLAFSDDGGHQFGPAVRVDVGDPLGRVGVTLLDDGSALVSWLEARGEEGLVQARWVGRRGEPGEVTTVARTAATRASGFPRIARSGNRVFFVWTQTGERPLVRVAVARIVY